MSTDRVLSRDPSLTTISSYSGYRRFNSELALSITVDSSLNVGASLFVVDALAQALFPQYGIAVF
jgi:hypothetical protein